MSIRVFLKRIWPRVNCSLSCYIVAYIYLRRFTKRYPLALIDSYSIHNFIITSLLLAAKFMHNKKYKNPDFAILGLLPKAEMHMLETKFLAAIDYRLHVSTEEYMNICIWMSMSMSKTSEICPSPSCCYEGLHQHSHEDHGQFFFSFFF
ncbi:cyclin-U4-3-like [Dioscorea cayenensis subsp. rotundata]|uniref:Cyclin-U4-3-like n=1 Tax=Dioscorea cayennensis subsp. rotundata TaxID=55577 RepID=A0AB40B6N0_DIOCR|nr:cyclin-U4-3-like [Dioscorea cayenensis subsp. rotundata]